ncbi:aspartyl protease family protein [Pedobacter yonginense]|nr:aspartyl protease family protein [Pedobacter yonginense]
MVISSEQKLFCQNFTFPGNREKQSIDFKLVKNLIIIPVKINGKGPFNFILDTGVGPTIITDPTIIDSADFKGMRKTSISGLGNSDIPGFLSQNISCRIGQATLQNMPTAILERDYFNLSGYLGMQVQGIIGYHFLNSFIVDVRYGNNRIVFYQPYAKVRWKGDVIPIKIENQKAYLMATTMLENGQIDTSKFIIDTGASHALSMEMKDDKAYPLPKKAINANLGMSLSGQIRGYVGRTFSFTLGKYVFSNVLSGYPDFDSIEEKIKSSKRNGNLGADILRRFNIQINYKDGYIRINPNRFYKDPFDYDMVGMVVYLDQSSFSRFFIGEIDADSPAEKAGLLPSDEILGINLVPITQYTMQQLNHLFTSGQERSLIVEVYRAPSILYKVVKMKKRI